MIVYAESSAVLRWLFNEGGGNAVRERLQAAEKVVCSRLTLIECRRAARRAVTESRITEAELGEVLAVLARASVRWAVFEIAPDVAERAGASFPAEPVRTLDAVHLASALILRESLPELTVVSTEERVRRNCELLGLPVFPAVGEA